MPELPEVEHVRLSILGPLTGATLTRVDIHRPDVCEAWTPRALRPARRADLLAGARITELRRHGKQLAIIAGDARVMCVQLGMTGGLFITSSPAALKALDHAHVVWTINAGAERLVFRDPRRFGGIVCYPSAHDLERHRWSTLGPDALHADPDHLHAALRNSARPIKAALLDQSVLAGVGNIYADEALFRARISPRRHAGRLHHDELARLAAAVRHVLHEAIHAGGSSIRDYRDARGEPGSFQSRHQVYGRSGLPCLNCGSLLRRLTITQRTTVMCPTCQSGDTGKPRNQRDLSTTSAR